MVELVDTLSWGGSDRRSCEFKSRPEHQLRKTAILRSFLLTSIRNDFVRSVYLDARPDHARKVIYPFQTFTISYVACILMHDQTAHRTLFNSFGYSRFRVWRASWCTTKPPTESYLPLSDIHDFVCSVHLDARPNHARKVIYPFQTFTISCVACILMHDQTAYGKLFTPFRHSRFRV